MIRVDISCAILLGLLVVVGCASAERHESGDESAVSAPRPAWNQADVAKLARNLQHSFDRLRALERSRPPDSIVSGQAHAQQRYRDLLRGLETQSRSLADRTEKGESREDTANLFNRLDELGRDAARQARRMFLSRETIDEIQKAEALMNRLQVYYKGTADPRPALVGPSKDDDEAAGKAE